MLNIIPLGGLGEIGLNMMVFESDDTIFVVDAGLMFPEDYMLGVDIVIPDMDYLIQRKSKVAGIVLTHAHEDHIGALPYLLREIDAPVFGTPFTLGMVRAKLEAHDLLSATSLYEINPRERLKIGVFDLEFIRVSHSVVDGVGIAIRTPEGVVVHTGDFKMGRTIMDSMMTDVNKFAQYGEEGVLALLSDSTNVEREGYTTAAHEIGETLTHIAAGCKGRIIVALFASNIGRIQQIVNIAAARGSKVLFNGRSIENSVAIARDLGYIDIPDGLEITLEQINNYPDNQIMMITTGSQGEPLSVLARVAAGQHKQLKIRDGDTVILSSKFIPGNERAIGKIINNLYRKGANVIYEKISDVHVSGHAFQEELKLMINLVKPKYFVPIHGEYRHLVLHARLAGQSGIPEDHILLVENGGTIAFDEGRGSVGEPVTTGRMLVDGKGVGDVGSSVLRHRRKLSEEGMVVVNLIFDADTGAIVHGPEIVSRGFVFEFDLGHLLDEARAVIREVVETIAVETEERMPRIQSGVQSALRRHFSLAIRRKPVIICLATEIPAPTLD
ncbi:MAG: ribonuclease J [Desulfobacterales bacterium]